MILDINDKKETTNTHKTATQIRAGKTQKCDKTQEGIRNKINICQTRRNRRVNKYKR